MGVPRPFPLLTCKWITVRSKGDHSATRFRGFIGRNDLWGPAIHQPSPSCTSVPYYNLLKCIFMGVEPTTVRIIQLLWFLSIFFHFHSGFLFFWLIPDSDTFDFLPEKFHVMYIFRGTAESYKYSDSFNFCKFFGSRCINLLTCPIYLNLLNSHLTCLDLLNCPICLDLLSSL